MVQYVESKFWSVLAKGTKRLGGLVVKNRYFCMCDVSSQDAFH